MLEKELQSLLFIFKKVQIYFKTWKNKIEISFAYANTYKSRDTISGFAKNVLKWLLIIIMITVASLVVYNEKDIFKNKIAFSLEKKEKISSKIITDKKQFLIPHDSSVAVSEIESTLTQFPVENKIQKPLIKKFDMIQIKDTSDYFILVANKAFKTLYLIQKQFSAWRVVKEYDIAIGEQDGKKIHAGDRRTPEGLYFIVGRKEFSELSIIYGPLAYVLNYPNEEDHVAGRTGQGIWIHGTHPDSVPIETKGCLEMKNNELKELARYLKRGIGVPVLILNDLLISDPLSVLDYKKCDDERKVIIDNYNKSRIQFEQFLMNWKIAWETKNIVDYETYYDTLHFKGQGLDWYGWKERKLHTFDLYDTIAITIDNVLITDYSEQTTIVKFHQLYKTNLNKNENSKKLSLEKVDNVWKIISESTCLKEELLL